MAGKKSKKLKKKSISPSPNLDYRRKVKDRIPTPRGHQWGKNIKFTVRRDFCRASTDDDKAPEHILSSLEDARRILETPNPNVFNENNDTLYDGPLFNPNRCNNMRVDLRKLKFLKNRDDKLAEASEPEVEILHPPPNTTASGLKVKTSTSN